MEFKISHILQELSLLKQLLNSVSFTFRAFRHYAVVFILLGCMSSAASTTEIKGELLKWHKVILLFEGPDVKEEPATFRDYRLNVTFTKGDQKFVAPGHYAADGNAAHTGASSGNKWRVLFSPNETGEWLYKVSFRTGTNVAVSLDAKAGKPYSPLDGETGTFVIGPSDKKLPDFRARGLLRYTGGHYQQFAEDDSYWLSIGPGSPENLFGGSDVDATRIGMEDQYYADHIEDWRPGDPLWGDGKGKGLIGALNYIIDIGQTSIFVGMMNAFCDSDDTWPWPEKDISVDGMSTFDVSKLDQWEIIVDHTQKNGMVFHAYFSEEESEQIFEKVEGLEIGGESSFPIIRKLYYREILSRLGHFNAIDWSLGEELGGCAMFEDQEYGYPVTSNGQIKLYADYIKALDPYGHSLGFEGDLDVVMVDYGPWFGGPEFNRASIQGNTKKANWFSTELRAASKCAGKPWVIHFSEHHFPNVVRNLTEEELPAFRKSAWGTFLGGGASVEWWLSQDDYFLRSYKPYRQVMVELAVARDFMLEHIPFWKMEPANNLLEEWDTGYCFATRGEIYAIYLFNAVNNRMTFRGMTGTFDIFWYDPIKGGELQRGSILRIEAGKRLQLGKPPYRPEGDWTVLIRKTDGSLTDSG